MGKAKILIVTPQAVVGGVQYAPFEQVFDQQKEGRTRWVCRFHAQLAEKPKVDVSNDLTPKGFFTPEKVT